MPKRRRILYEEWVRVFGADLYRMAYRLCGDTNTAEDLVQETFYHAWKDMSKLRDHSKARPWLFQMLRYRYAHMVRDQMRRIKADSIDSLAGQVADPSPSPLARLTDRDTLQVALDDLDERLKAPLLMVFLEGLTCREAAEALDIPLGTVLSRIHRARQRLRSTVKADNRSVSEPSASDSIAGQSNHLRLGDEA